eukprot:9504036-Pyramimonas_sp.AAC.1
MMDVSQVRIANAASSGGVRRDVVCQVRAKPQQRGARLNTEIFSLGLGTSRAFDPTRVMRLAPVQARHDWEAELEEDLYDEYNIDDDYNGLDDITMKRTPGGGVVGARKPKKSGKPKQGKVTKFKGQSYDEIDDWTQAKKGKGKGKGGKGKKGSFNEDDEEDDMYVAMAAEYQ